eukprot:NODE_3851_length_845_cov_1.030641_g3828_i0.p2 GENE.NODE_3851_length_845_cov_1.030641_g3828_i0~~NODE_3851_length_845_cov_1.030641_g3828_i0.p2  ORF type:complete len:100 (-),score=16.05 NODE_3851_length_845_cov_1.030641_g3828_i0:544-843(-)
MIDRAIKADCHGFAKVRAQKQFKLFWVADHGNLELFILNQATGRADLFGNPPINFCAKILNIITAKEAKQDGFDNNNCDPDLENQTAKQAVKKLLHANL